MKLWTAKLQETLDLSKNIIQNQSIVPVIEMNLTLQTVFEKPLVRSVFKEEAGQIGYSVVKILCSRFMDSFGFSTKMNDTQIESLTVDVLEFFSYETLEDIILFFKMARSGKLGTTNRGVDSNLILGTWAPAYLELKAIEREKIIQKEKSSHKIDQLTIEDVKKAHEKAIKANSNDDFIEKVKNYVEKITNGISREHLENLILEWSNDEQKKKYLDILKRKRQTIK